MGIPVLINFNVVIAFTGVNLNSQLPVPVHDIFVTSSKGDRDVLVVASYIPGEVSTNLVDSVVLAAPELNATVVEGIIDSKAKMVSLSLVYMTKSLFVQYDRPASISGEE